MGRFPSSPFEPAIRAILHLHPRFDFSRIDVITDRWALVRLLELAYQQEMEPLPSKKAGSQSPYSEELFNFAVQLVGKTVIFIRNDKINVKKRVRKFNAFRKEFGKSHLPHDNDVAGSVQHYRLTTYKLGGLRLLIRNAVDGYLTPGFDTAEVAEGVTEGSSSEQSESIGGLRVRSAGTLLPPSCLLELNTLKEKAAQAIRLTEKRREAWVSQSGHFMVARWVETTPKDAKAPDGFSHRRAVFPKEKMRFMDPINPPANVLRRYRDSLQNIIEGVQSRAAGGEGDRYKVTQVQNCEHPVISPCWNISALPFDLSERMKESK